VFAVLTIDFRRRKNIIDMGPPGDLANWPVALVAPADLPALGYLPADCRVLAGCQLAALQKNDSGRQLLEQLYSGKSALGLKELETWTGLKTADIDHLAMGIRINEDLLQLIVVIRTQKPYNAEKVARTATTVKPAKLHGRPYYQAP